MTVQIVSSADYSDLRGPYCETRPGGCCPGRMDECSVPILGTLCYCDEFCNRTRSEDCCPDYWTFCKGQPAPPPPPIPQPVKRCYNGGRYYNYGEEIKLNCNKCKCDSVNPSTIEFLCEQNVCLVEPGVISSINSNRQLGWSASNYSMFWGKTLDDGITYKTGTLLPHRTVKRMMPVKVKKVGKLPNSFDARNKWPGWILGPADQGWCGASWAVSTASVASDRYAIMSKGLTRVDLSPQHLLSCNKGQRGCQGGHLSRAWTFIRKFGLVDESCYPWTGTPTKCKIPKRATLITANCPPVSGQGLRTDLYRVGPAYKIQSEGDIMEEIIQSGPVQATMKVHQDFFSYKTGVYTKSNMDRDTKTFGYHSVKIIGWGEETDIYGQPIKYWLAANSWGPHWGENGFFKIRRGTNECEIEEFVLAAWAETDDPSRDIVNRFQQEFRAAHPTYVNRINNTLYFDRWDRRYG
ncbi:hypothetical protein RUM43_007146 [Polyplax serrata]|uniref:SMB domain-containing protein n=1 Tax=Polyplax serrata TaxID=468196 RepID=A0AAN8PC66_POLSC